VVAIAQQVNDEETAYDILFAIQHFCGRLGAGIKVAVNDRAVVLSGTVAALPTKERAEHLARHYGALNVRNDIEVIPNEQS
jgi:osmotically-inducible protein OsmY